MVKEAKAKRAFEIKERGDEHVVTVTTARAGCIVAFWAAFLPLLAAFGLSFMLWEEGFVWGTVAAVAAFFFLARMAFTPKTETLKITPKGIVARNTLYRFENIETLGFENPTSGRIHNTNTSTGMGTYAAAQVSYWIYAVHGTQKVPLVMGLDEHTAQQLYGRIIDICAGFGARFG